MGLLEVLDTEVFGVTLKIVARVIVFGGIAIILIRKLLRRLRQPADSS
jgi:hypothetical protein